MNSEINILKGVHPGQYLARILKRRGLKGKALAAMVDEHPQTLSAIIRGRRSMNTSLSLKIEQALDLEEGLLMTLQVFYDIARERQIVSSSDKINLSLFRKILFWDTSLDKIDWKANESFVINRVFSRGNEKEINEIIRFYGRDSIISLLDFNNKYALNTQQNAQKYLGYAL